MKRLLLIGMALLTAAGCKTLVPYDSKFMCEANQDYGRCMSVSDAYKEALEGPAPAEAKKHPEAWNYKQGAPKKTSTRGRKARDEYRMMQASLSGRDLYKDNEYREMAALIEQPATPIVQPPKVLRTLVVSYPNGQTLYMPRYIVYIAEEARFVVGDYLNEEKAGGAMLYPTAQARATDSNDAGAQRSKKEH